MGSILIEAGEGDYCNWNIRSNNLRRQGRGIEDRAHHTSDPHLMASRCLCGKRPYRTTMGRFGSAHCWGGTFRMALWCKKLGRTPHMVTRSGYRAVGSKPSRPFCSEWPTTGRQAHCLKDCIMSSTAPPVGSQGLHFSSFHICQESCHSKESSS